MSSHVAHRPYHGNLPSSHARPALAGGQEGRRPPLKTQEAVLHGTGTDWEVTELDLDPPREGEVLIRYVAAGLCHSDEHLRTGDLEPRFPCVGGHEGAGVVE